MRGTMMDFPLTLPTILERAGKIFPQTEVIWRRADRSVAKTCYGEVYRRARRLADALTRMGLRPGERVASMMWNHATHLETFWGVPCAGGILHTLNLRLHANEIAAIANHAQDRFLIVDDILLPIYEKFAAEVPFEKVIVAPYGCGTVPDGMLNYEELITGASDDFVYPKIDENQGAAMCFTSGTTGRSKGVVYSHRALVLHSLNCLGVDSFGISMHDTVMPVASLFHANGWGIPFTAAVAGAKLVLPGPFADAEGILDLMEQERVTVALGVPTIWYGVLDALNKYPGRWKLSWPVRLIVGGAAASESLMRGFDRHGITVFCAW